MKKLIDYFSKNLEFKIYTVFSSVGTEASILVNLLDVEQGQKYRAELAELILKKKDIWLADEFCADLDFVTAQFVQLIFQNG